MAMDVNEVQVAGIYNYAAVEANGGIHPTPPGRRIWPPLEHNRRIHPPLENTPVFQRPPGAVFHTPCTNVGDDGEIRPPLVVFSGKSHPPP